MTTLDVTLDSLFEATDSAPRARRNLRFGLWAGQRLGLSGGPLAVFASGVMQADHEESGDHDVLCHVARELDGAGLGLPGNELQGRLAECEREARLETLHHD